MGDGKSEKCGPATQYFLDHHLLEFEFEREETPSLDSVSGCFFFLLPFLFFFLEVPKNMAAQFHGTTARYVKDFVKCVPGHIC